MAKYYITACEEFYSDISSNRGIQIHLAEIQSMCPKYIQSILSFNRLSTAQRKKAASTLNSLVTTILKGDAFPDEVDVLRSPDYDEDDMRSTLGNAYVTIDTFDWDILETEDITNHSDIVVVEDIETEDMQHVSQDTCKIKRKVPSDLKENAPSNVEPDDMLNENEFVQYKSTRADISLSFRIFPIRDIKNLWRPAKDLAGRSMMIYKTLPEIPSKQSEITITTEVDDMTDSDLIKLFPDHFIRPRRPEMYDNYEGFSYHDKLGYIPKISGFTEEQVIDNLIRYPIFAYMFRRVDGKRVVFNKHVEVDGELLTSQQAYEKVEDVKNLPNNIVFFWEYSVRRYLLERDHNTVKHKYPLEGSCDPFTTLFMTPEEYRELGYIDSIDIARQCVQNRVKFWRTRNPLTKHMYPEFPIEYPKCDEKRDCKFVESCTRDWCDYSCGIDDNYDVMYERCNISGIELKYKQEDLIRDWNTIVNSDGVICIQSKDISNKVREIVYTCICRYIKAKMGPHVVHVSYSTYVQQIKDSWSQGVSDKLQRLQNNINNVEILVISGLDYCIFNDFESQTILNLIESRKMENKYTVIVLKDISQLSGKGLFLVPLKNQLKEVLVNDRIN